MERTLELSGDIADAPTTVFPAQSSMAGRMGKAALWSGLNSFVLRFGQFGVGVVVARIIEPKQFGIFAVALTVHAVIVNVSELGVSAALVRAKDNVNRIAPTVASISILSSAGLMAAMYLSASWLATLLGAPAAAGAIRILSVTVLLGGITAVPYALLVRAFRQDKRFFADCANFVVSTVAVIALGLAGLGATALAVSRVLGIVATMILLYAMVSPRYRPGWDRQEAAEVLRYSLPLAGANVVNFSLNNADYVVVGRVLGALPLGFYMLAYNISGWPVSLLGLVINEVALPAFAHAREYALGLPDRARGVMSLTAGVAFPISALIFVLAHPLVLAVYGGRWAEAAPALGMLGLFGTIRIMLGLITNILAALGRSREVLVVQLAWIATLIPALIVGVRGHGILGAAIAQEVVGIGIVVPLALIMVARAGCGSAWSLAAACRLPFIGSAMAAVVAWLAADPVGPAILKVLVGGLAGLAVYLVLVGPWLRDRLRRASDEWRDPRFVPQPPGRHRVAKAKSWRGATSAGSN